METYQLFLCEIVLLTGDQLLFSTRIYVQLTGEHVYVNYGTKS